MLSKQKWENLVKKNACLVIINYAGKIPLYQLICDQGKIHREVSSLLDIPRTTVSSTGGFFKPERCEKENREGARIIILNEDIKEAY
ncbi:hypothetical protein HZS_3990 [Henneguya salminicola]|nr:hypothetical protein HZS_3990 [Henneguya salminicola]